MKLRLLAVAILLLGVVAAAGPEDAAQERDRLEIALPPVGLRGTEPPSIRSLSMLRDSRTRDLLHHGFPARLHYTVELWSTRGWFDDLLARREWDVVVRYTPLDGRYTVTRLVANEPQSLGSFDQLSDVQDILDEPYQPRITPPAVRDRMYYNVALEIEMLSVNDLDELERWLRGELKPATQGERSPGTALTRGVRSLVVRLLGSENRSYEVRSGTFRVSTEDSR